MSTTKSKMRPVVAVIIILIVVAAGGIYYYNTTTQQPSKPKVPKILKVAIDLDMTTWDPSQSYSTEVYELANLYEPLMWANPPGSKEPFTPALATSWDVSPDSLTWTFHLRSGVKFHDGEPFNAQAVLYSINRTKSMGLGAAYLWSIVDTMQVVDDLTLKMNLKSPAPLTRIASAEYASWIFSPKSAEKGSDWFEEGNEAGTGPWMLQSYKPRDEIVLTRFPDYWGGWNDNQYDVIDIKYVTESTVQRQMLEGGSADIVNTIPNEAISIVNSTTGLIVYKFPSAYNYIIYLNNQKPPLNNKLVRQALSYAMPYDDIMKVGAPGYSTQAVGPVPRGLYPNDPTLPQYKHDLTKAKELLTEAGYPNGFKLTFTYAAENPAETLWVPIIKSELAKIGVNVDVRGIPWVEQWAQAQNQDFQKDPDMFAILWWPAYSDGFDNLNSMFHSEKTIVFNLGYYYNSTYDNLIDTAYSEEAPNPARAQELYSQAQKMLIDDAAAIYLYDVQSLQPMRTSIKGFVGNLFYPSVLFFYPLYTESSSASIIAPVQLAVQSLGKQLQVSVTSQGTVLRTSE